MFDLVGSVAEEAAALARLTDAELASYEGADLGAAIVQVDAAIRQLEAARLSLTRVHSRSSAWRRDGANFPAQWHRRHRKVSGGQARRDVETANALSNLPRTAAAVADGTVSASQAAAAARAGRGLSAEHTRALDDLVADQAPDASDRQLRDAVSKFADEAAPDTARARERQAHERRTLRLGRAQDGGWWVDGRLDVIGGEALATAISALSRPRGDGDERTAEQRRADALADLAERALRTGELPIEGGHRPTVSATADLRTLEGRAGAPAGRLDHTGPVDPETVRQLACDANVHRVITDGASEVLDVGRTRRAVTRAQRRALVARDGGCVGCGAPPGWTDAHHIVHWEDGGPTDLNNLLLLCRTCHTNVHHRRWRIVTDAAGRLRVRRPSGHRRRGDERNADDGDGGPGDEGRPRPGRSSPAEADTQHRHATVSRTPAEGHAPDRQLMLR